MLLAARQKRTAPMRDDKVLADWNGMMIAALANAGAVFRNGKWLTAAIQAFDFVVKALGDGDRLYHSWRDGKRAHIGFSDDYAHMARAAFVLYEATADRRYLVQAQKWVHVLNEHFWDSQLGGYFFTPDDSDPLIVRGRQVFDQNAPCANGIMVALLGRLYFVTGDQAYRDRCNALIQSFAAEVNRVAISMGSFMNSLEVAALGQAGRHHRTAQPSKDTRAHQCRARTQSPEPVPDDHRSEPAFAGGPSCGRQGDAERPTDSLCLPADDRDIAHHQSGDPVSIAAIAAADGR